MGWPRISWQLLCSTREGLILWTGRGDNSYTALKEKRVLKRCPLGIILENSGFFGKKGTVLVPLGYQNGVLPPNKRALFSYLMGIDTLIKCYPLQEMHPFGVHRFWPPPVIHSTATCSLHMVVSSCKLGWINYMSNTQYISVVLPWASDWPFYSRNQATSMDFDLWCKCPLVLK